MKTDPGLWWVSKNRKNNVEFPAICRICNGHFGSLKWPFWDWRNMFQQLQLIWSLKIQFWIDDVYLNYFPHSEMAISEYKNGHFEEIRAWLQILEWGSNSTIFYLTFDTHDSPRAVFNGNGKFRDLISLCGLGITYQKTKTFFLFFFLFASVRINFVI